MNRGFWRHALALDAYILILKVQYRCPKYIKAKVEWWVRGRFIGIKANVKILAAEFSQWNRVDSEGL